MVTSVAMSSAKSDVLPMPRRAREAARMMRSEVPSPGQHRVQLVGSLSIPGMHGQWLPTSLSFIKVDDVENDRPGSPTAGLAADHRSVCRDSPSAPSAVVISAVLARVSFAQGRRARSINQAACLDTSRMI